MSNTAALLQVLRNTLTEELKLYYYASNDLCKDAALKDFARDRAGEHYSFCTLHCDRLRYRDGPLRTLEVKILAGDI